MGGIGAVAEPLVVIALLFGGTWINRDFDPGRKRWQRDTRRVPDDKELGRAKDAETLNSDEEMGDSRSSSPSLLAEQEPKWRTRAISIWRVKREVTTPNTRRFKGYFLSRLLERFPFLVECWYWALIYWVYQLGRAASAVFILEGTIVAARKHALQVINLEQSLHIFIELPIQRFFMSYPTMMIWINRIYSFIHIPGSIAFLVWLFYYTHTFSRQNLHSSNPAGPGLYQSRRRTMAFCNLLAFIIFTAWPCMPPRLLSADTEPGSVGQRARSYGFVDTVHGPGGEGSMWTDNRFTNKFAAMPSLHFGYSLLIGMTVATIPLRKRCEIEGRRDWRRAAWVAVGVFYPALILTAIIATANHFLLDAVAGATVCGVAWWGNGIMINLCALEDWFLWCVRICKPEAEMEEGESGTSSFGLGILGP